MTRLKGRATFRGNKLYLDEISWTMVKRIAALTHRSPKNVVIRALTRMKKYEKSKVS